MRVLAYLLIGVLGGMGLMTIFQDRGQNSSSSLSYAMSTSEQVMEDSKLWTGEDLLEMAKIYDQQADDLQSEAVRLEQRALNLGEKPYYMDPKGFTRAGWMLVASSRWKATKEMRELAEMHRSEGQRLLEMEKAGGTLRKNLDKDG